MSMLEDNPEVDYAAGEGISPEGDIPSILDEPSTQPPPGRPSEPPQSKPPAKAERKPGQLTEDAMKFREAERAELPEGKSPHTINWWLSTIQGAEAQEKTVEAQFEDRTKQPAPIKVREQVKQLGYDKPIEVKPASPVFKVYDYDNDRFVEVSREQFEERGKVYAQFPQIAPPATPGKMTPTQFDQWFKDTHRQVGINQWIPNAELEKLKGEQPELHKTLTTRGYDAYTRAVEERNKQLKATAVSVTTKTSQQAQKAEDEFKKNNTKLPDGQWVDNKALAEIKKQNKTQHDLLTKEGYSSYLNALDGAEKTLKPYYREKLGKYDVVNAILTRDKEVDQAIITLFPDDIVKAVVKAKKPGLTIGRTEEEIKRSPLFRSLAEASTLPIVMAARPVVRSTPTPLDDIGLWVAIGGTAAYLVVKSGAAEEIPKLAKAVPFAIREAYDDFVERYKRQPTTADVVLVGSDGMATTLIEFAPGMQRIPGFTITRLDTSIPGIKPTPQEVKTLATLPGFTIDKIDTALPPDAVSRVNPVVLLPTPAVTLEELTGMRAGVITAQAEVAVVEKKLQIATETIPINWNKILEESQKAKKQEDIEKAFAVINSSMRKTDPKTERAYLSVYEEYLRKRLLLEQAKRQYIASLNPTPIRGKISDEALDAFASIALSEVLKEKIKPAESLNQYLRRTVAPGVDNAYRSSVRVAIETLNRQIEQTRNMTRVMNEVIDQTAIETVTNLRNMNLTDTQTQTLTQVITDTALKNALRQATQTQTLTRTQARTATKAITSSAIAEAVTSAIQALATTTTTATTAATATTTGRTFPRKGADSDKQKRKRIREARGAIAWRMGELHGNDRWDVLVYPYKSRSDYMSIFGRMPSGATLVKGPESAYKTAVLLYGKRPSKAVSLDMGIQDVKIKPISGSKGVKISFEADPKLETTGDINISKRGRTFPLS